ncbi:MAG: hypothetical protein R3327_03785 [Nitrosopumilaceae archaeon]|nr:hypothetical protein [Nitrosopumilaceae archaeon]
MKLVLHIVLGIIAVSSLIGTAYAQEKIGIFTLNSEITITEDILVTGFVDVNADYKPVRLEVYDPNGELIYRPDVYFNDKGEFSWLFHPPLGKFDSVGTYTIIASHEDLSESSKLQFVVKEKSVANPLTKNISDKNKSNSESDESTEPIRIIESKNEQKLSNNSVEQTDDRTKIISDSPLFVMSLGIVSVAAIVGIIIWVKQSYKRSISV